MDLAAHTVGSATRMEFCLGLAFLRGAPMLRAASEIQGWLEPSMPAEALERVAIRMTDGGWLVPHPATPRAFVLTDEGDKAIELAFKGLVRFVDGGQGRWDVARMFQIIKTSYDGRRN